MPDQERWPVAEIKRRAKKIDDQPRNKIEQELTDQIMELGGPDKLPKGFISITQVNAMHKCGRSYEYRYIEGIQTPTGVALEEGKSHHAALEFNGDYKRRTGKDLDANGLNEVFQDEWSKRQKAVEDDKWDGHTPESVSKRGTELTELYIRDFAPSFFPVENEIQFAESVCGIPVYGWIDVVGLQHREFKPMRKPDTKKGRWLLLDYKVTGQAKTVKDVDNSVQLGMYEYHLPQVEGVGMVSLMRKRRAEIKTAISPTSEGRVLMARWQVLWGALKAIREEFSPTDPSSWACTPKWCDYFDICRGMVEKGGKR